MTVLSVCELVRLFAAEEARRQRERIDELRRRNGEAPGHKRKQRALIHERVEAVRPDLTARRIAAHGQVVREHRLHVRRKERRIPPQPVAHRLVQEDGDLVVGLLSDEHRFRQRHARKFDVEAGVDARARDDGRDVAARRCRRAPRSPPDASARRCCPSRASNDGIANVPTRSVVSTYRYSAITDPYPRIVRHVRHAGRAQNVERGQRRRDDHAARRCQAR